MIKTVEGQYNGDFKTEWIHTKNHFRGSLELYLDGTAAGTIAIEYSNYDSQTPPPVNHVGHIPDADTYGGQFDLSGDDNHFWKLKEIPGNWMRLVTTDCIGEGSYAVVFVGKT